MSEANGSALENVTQPDSLGRPETPKRRHIVLTSHPSRSGLKGGPVQWGHGDPLQRGAIVATVTLTIALARTDTDNALPTHMRLPQGCLH